MNKDVGPSATHAVHWGGDRSSAPVICATSAWNGLATSAYQTWAFRRAEITAFVGSPFRTLSGGQATMAQIRSLEPRSYGVTRMEAIARRTLSDLLPSLAGLPRPSQVGLVLCLPQRMDPNYGEKRDIGDRRMLEKALIEVFEQAGLEVVLQVEPRGHAAMAFALAQAGHAIASRQLEAVIVGGVDTHYDPFVMEQWLDDGRVLDAEHLDATVPGEGGAFVLLMRGSAVRRAGLTPLAQVESVATNQEPATRKNDVACVGLGLSRAALAISKRLKQERRTLDWWISDMTGESMRVQEFQLAWPRAARAVMLPTGVLEWLPTHLGDLGAATMPTAMVVAVEGFRRGDPPNARTCVITGSSEHHDRGVVLLGRAPEESRS